jgi:ATP dependent DNA ligase domain
MVECIFNTQPEITSFILDSEIVAIDAASGSLRSFQELSSRARKEVQLRDIQISVCVFAFDLMYFNGEVRKKLVFISQEYILMPGTDFIGTCISGEAIAFACPFSTGRSACKVGCSIRPRRSL